MLTPTPLGSGRHSFTHADVPAYVEQLEDRCMLAAALPGLLGGGITALPAETIAAGVQAGVINTNTRNPSAFATGGATNSVATGVGAVNPLGTGNSGNKVQAAGGVGAAGIGPSAITTAATGTTGTTSTTSPHALLVGAVYSGTASLNRKVPVSTALSTSRPGMTLSFTAVGANGLVDGVAQVQGLGDFNFTGLLKGTSFHGVLSGPGAGTITGTVSTNNSVLRGSFSETQGGTVVRGSYQVTTSGTGAIALAAPVTSASGTGATGIGSSASIPASASTTISSARNVPGIGGTYSGTLHFSKKLTSSFGGGTGASGIGALSASGTSVNAINIDVTSETSDGLLNGILNVQSLGDSPFVGVVTGNRVDLIFNGSGGSGEVVGTLSRNNSTLSGRFTDTLNGQIITGSFRNVNAAISPTVAGASGTTSTASGGGVLVTPVANTNPSTGIITPFPTSGTGTNVFTNGTGTTGTSTTGTTTGTTGTTSTGTGAAASILDTGSTGIGSTTMPVNTTTGIGSTTTPVNSLTGVGSTTMPVNSTTGAGGLITVTQPVTSTGGITSSTSSGSGIGTSSSLSGIGSSLNTTGSGLSTGV
ncbi:MAG: hypothetical protein JWN51_3379 [Phycisphaerales bacterium]|nr:hypothetical protein [Phycisphaerales bacterium]